MEFLTDMENIKDLYNLLYRGAIMSESDFLLYFKYCDDKVTSQEYPMTTIMRIHLDEGYCEIDVRENPFYRYSSSSESFYKHAGDLPIRFYNYDDREFSSFNSLQWRYVETAQRRIEKQILDKVMTIEELYNLCDSEEGREYERFLSFKNIQYRYYFIMGHCVAESWLYFDVIDTYTPIAIDRPEDYVLLKDVRVHVTKVEIRR